MNTNIPQPPPTHNEWPEVWQLVIDEITLFCKGNNKDKKYFRLLVSDMQKRNELGKAKYGTALQPFNGRDALIDAYQEALDLVVYLRQCVCEEGHGRDIRQRSYYVEEFYTTALQFVVRLREIIYLETGE